MIAATVQEVGRDAMTGEEPVLVLFGPQATPSIRQVAVVQEVEQDVIFDLKDHDKIKIGSQEYTIEKVGRLANQHLQELGHVTLFFQAAPEEETIGNALYLAPYEVPEVKKGMSIHYQVS